MTLGTDVREAIRREMELQGLGLRETARQMKRSHHWLGTKLRGVSPMTTDDIEEIAAALGLDPVRLITESGQDAHKVS